jgi:phosphate transport system permease protein
LRKRKRIDAVRWWSVSTTAVVCAALAGAVLYLLIGSVDALRSEGAAFFTSSRWLYRRTEFGAASMLFGSAVVAALALVLAVPVAIAAAVFVSEMCTRRLHVTLKVAVELLAGIPSVVYGLLGVLFLRDWISRLFDRFHVDALSADTLLTAGVLLAVMVLPTITTLADDAMHAVPRSAREAARGLGLTRAETVLTVVIPQAAPGLVGAVLLGFGRAIGETIAVFLVVGRADNRPMSMSALFDAGQTITSKLGGSETNIAVGDPLHMSAMIALGLVLLVVVLGVAFAAQALRNRITEAQ